MKAPLAGVDGRRAATGAAPGPRKPGLTGGPPPPTPAERGRSSARGLLCGSTPGEILVRLVEGDPLGARRAVRTRLEQRALLLDAERVTLRTLARCARYASTLGRRASLERWVVGQVDAAIDELRLAQARDGRAPLEDGSTVYEQLARPLGLDPARVRAACVAFNQYEARERRAFYHLCLRGVSLDDSARAERVSASTLARRARLVLDGVLTAVVGTPPGLPPGLPPGPGVGAAGATTETRDDHHVE